MKRMLFGAIVVACLLNIGQSFGQDSSNVDEKKQIKIPRTTFMEKFDPDLALTAEERRSMRVALIKELRLKKSILDTLDISDRRRQKLLKDLHNRPFSDRLQKTMAELKFDEGIID